MSSKKSVKKMQRVVDQMRLNMINEHDLLDIAVGIANKRNELLSAAIRTKELTKSLKQLKTKNRK